MLFRKKGNKEKSPRGLRALLQKKPKEQRKSSLLFYFVLILLIIFALNVVLLLPPQLSSVFFEIEIFIISFLRQPVTFQTWIWILMFLFTWLFGYMFTPFLTIPSTEELYIVRDAWIEGDIMYFKTFTGKILGIYKDFVYSTGVWKFKHYYVYGRVSRIAFEDYTLYQSAELEVTRSILAERLAKQLAEENAVLREMLKRYEPYLSIEDIKALIYRPQEGSE